MEKVKHIDYKMITLRLSKMQIHYSLIVSHLYFAKYINI
jgi:hypothetical protein